MTERRKEWTERKDGRSLERERARGRGGREGSMVGRKREEIKRVVDSCDMDPEGPAQIGRRTGAVFGEGLLLKKGVVEAMVVKGGVAGGISVVSTGAT